MPRCIKETSARKEQNRASDQPTARGIASPFIAHPEHPLIRQLLGELEPLMRRYLWRAFRIQLHKENRPKMLASLAKVTHGKDGRFVSVAKNVKP